MTISMQKVAVTLPDGTVAILSVVTRAPLKSFGAAAAASAGFSLSGDGEWWESSATDARIEREISRNPRLAGNKGWRRLDDAEIPPDRTFRNAWRDSGKIGVDMDAAREIHKGHLRAIRAPMLNKLDTEYMRADEAGDAALKLAIAARKQALRDVTADPAIAAAATPDELKAIIPEPLRGSAA